MRATNGMAIAMAVLAGLVSCKAKSDRGEVSYSARDEVSANAPSPMNEGAMGSAAGGGGAPMADPSASAPGDGKQGGKGGKDAQKPAESWKRSQIVPNSSRTRSHHCGRTPLFRPACAAPSLRRRRSRCVAA